MPKKLPVMTIRCSVPMVSIREIIIPQMPDWKWQRIALARKGPGLGEVQDGNAKRA